MKKRSALTNLYGTLDRVARWGIDSPGKFYSIFTFLFGLGLAIQYRRAQERGKRFVPFFLRRLLVLPWASGSSITYLFWIGDILILYAVLGIAVLLFRNCRPRTLLIWTTVFPLVASYQRGAAWCGNLRAFNTAVP